MMAIVVNIFDPLSNLFYFSISRYLLHGCQSKIVKIFVYNYQKRKWSTTEQSTSRKKNNIITIKMIAAICKTLDNDIINVPCKLG